MSFLFIKANILSEESNRKSIEETLVSLKEQKKTLEEKIRQDTTSGAGANPADVSQLSTLDSQIATNEANMLTSLSTMKNHLDSYHSLDPWDPTVIGNFDDDIPILLMPVRVETRFEHVVTPSSSNYELWIRIFPDDLAVETHEKALSEDEKTDGQVFWNIYSDAGKTKQEKVNAWNTLCVAHGAQRAGWIATYFEDGLTDEKFDAWSQQPRSRVLPDKFAVYLYEGYDPANTPNVPTRVVKGKPIPHTLKMGINPNDADSIDKIDSALSGGGIESNLDTPSEEIKWMVDFDEAIEKGMGMKITLTQAQYNAGFDRITVLGVKSVADKDDGKELMEDLLESHQFTNGWSILQQGINTKNTEERRSGYGSVEFGNEETYATEREGELYVPTTDTEFKTDGQRLAEALGIDYEFTQNVHRANGFDIRRAMMMHDTMFQSTIGYFMKNVMHPFFSPALYQSVYDPMVETRKFFTDFVRGRGALPSIRIGEQPYGILPVGSSVVTEGPNPATGEGNYFNDIYDLIGNIDGSRTAKIASIASAGDGNDPQSNLVDIMGRHAISSEFYQRSAAGPGFIWNQLTLGDMETEANTWFTNQQSFKTDFETETGLQFSETPGVLKLNFRSEQEFMTKPVVSAKRLSTTKALENHAGGNANYIDWLRTSTISAIREEDFTNIGAPAGSEAPQALLYDYMRQSLLLEYYELACDLGNVPYDDRIEKEFLNMQEDQSGPVLPQVPDPTLMSEMTQFKQMNDANYQAELAQVYQNPAVMSGFQAWTESGSWAGNEQWMIYSDWLEWVEFKMSQISGELDEDMNWLTWREWTIWSSRTDMTSTMNFNASTVFSSMTEPEKWRKYMQFLRLVYPGATWMDIVQYGFSWQTVANDTNWSNNVFAWIADRPQSLPAPPAPAPEHLLSSGVSRWAIFDSTPSGWSKTIGQYIDDGDADNDAAAASVVRVKRHLGDMATMPTADLSTLYSEMIDVCSYRVDSWKLGTMTRRLQKMRIDENTGQAKQGLYLGAYSWLENVRKADKTITSNHLPEGFPHFADVEEVADNQGYIHAPGMNHAIAAAMLRSGYEGKASAANQQTHEINMSSERVRNAKRLLQGLRHGVTLDALLGYEFERGLHDRHPGMELDKYILPFRDRFKITSVVEPENDTEVGVAASEVQSDYVVNGYELIKRFRISSDIVDELNLSFTPTGAEKTAVETEIDRIEGLLDAVSDLGVAEGAFQLVNNNPDAAGALSEALSGEGNVPQVNVTEDPRSGITVNNKIALAIEPKTTLDTSGYWAGILATPAANAEPSLNEWIKAMMPNPATVTCSVTIQDATPVVTDISLADLDRQPLDWVFLFGDELTNDESELSMLIKQVARTNSPATPYAHDMEVIIDYGTATSPNIPFTQLLPLLKYLRKVILDSKALSPLHFKSPGNFVEPDASNFDYAQLHNRVSDAVAVLTGAKTALQTEIDNYDASLAVSYADISNALMTISCFKVAGAIVEKDDPSDATYQPALLERARGVLGLLSNDDASGILNKITALGMTGATSTIDAPTAADYPNFIKTVQEIAALLFGATYRILPQFKFASEERAVWSNLTSAPSLNTLADDFSHPTAPHLEISEWMSGVSRVNQKVANLELVHTLHNMFQPNVNSFDYRPMQFPFDQDGKDRWMAVAVNNSDCLKNQRTSIAFNDTYGYNPDNYTCGLLVDDWNELIPDADQQTGVAFHYDQPNAKAPQCLLLALPSEFTGTWDWADLLLTVNETFDEAKKRALDYEDLSDTKWAQMSPLTYMPGSVGQMTIGHKID